MNNYLFFLVHQPLISTAEIEAVFSAKNFDYNLESGDKNILKLTTKKNIDPSILIEKLGGTVKITEQIADTNNVNDTIINFLQMAQPTGKIQFALNGKNNKYLSLEIKKILKKSGRSVRYIEIKNQEKESV